MSTIILRNNVKIGGNNPCFIIAEIGQNHQGDIEIAKKLIKAAKEAGADCVKFQKSSLKDKFTKQRLEQPYNNINSWGSTYGEHKRYLEFSEDEYRVLLKYAQDLDIMFTASAMDMESFDFLLNLKVPFIKIGSGDSNNLLYIKYAATKKIPLIVSTGMIDKATVTSIYDIISTQHKHFCLLHCVSAYPTPYEDCNLRVLQDYRNCYDVPVGYSGHELGIKVVIAAVALGAKKHERHGSSMFSGTIGITAVSTSSAFFGSDASNSCKNDTFFRRRVAGGRGGTSRQAAQARRARNSVSAARHRARFYIESTLFTQSNPEREVDKPYVYTYTQCQY
ncbi:Sialic acid synthase [Papilio xuthus]|uniref:Sialic acid synthase n=1 Tax=Papilio xuthus TaxID=66420 RepID=A0A194PUG5_PAPXU|nr:Sialic acid synthase [Papilio xuthus]